MTDRELKMVVLQRNNEGKATVWCDPEIADLVKALNDGGMKTVASCSGHGRFGVISLADGRELILLNGPPQNTEQTDPTKTALAIMHELLETTLSEMPSFHHGKEAQEAWADRRAKARNAAAAFLAAAAEIGKAMP